MLSPEELLGVFLTEGTLGSTSFAAGDSLSFGSRRRRLLTVGSISSFSSSGKSDGLNTVVLDCFVVVSLSKSLTGVYGMKSGNWEKQVTRTHQRYRVR